jgi:hypothetical protein
MMMIYQFGPSEDYEWILPAGKGSSTRLRHLLIGTDRGKLRDQWVAPLMELLTSDEHGRPRRPADMPLYSGSGSLVVNRRARSVLEPVLGDDAEYLDLVVEREEMWLVNAWQVVDALDEEKSVLKRFPNRTKVMEIVKYSFIPERLNGLQAFRIHQRPSKTFLAGSVVAAIRDAGLTGLSFRRVWGEGG